MREARCGAPQQGPAPHLRPRKLPPASRTPWVLLLLLLAGGASPGKGAPVAFHSSYGEQELQVWNEINEVCSTYLTSDTSSQSANALKDLCVMILDLQKTQELDEMDNTKRLPVLYSLLQIVRQMHEMRLKSYNEDDELRIPEEIQRRVYFIFRPRNGRRSVPFH